MARKEQIEAILDYQSKKRALVREVTGMDLIPDEVAITAEQLDEESVNRLIRVFQPTMFLSDKNCLHCGVFLGECHECPYSTILNDPCKVDGSTYKKIDKAWDEARDKELDSSDYDDDDNIATKIWGLGVDLRKSLDKA